jgi:hypothetical protein
MVPFLVPGPESFKTYLNQFDLIRPRTGNSLVTHITGVSVRNATSPKIFYGNFIAVLGRVRRD